MAQSRFHQRSGVHQSDHRRVAHERSRRQRRGCRHGREPCRRRLSGLGRCAGKETPAAPPRRSRPLGGGRQTHCLARDRQHRQADAREPCQRIDRRRPPALLRRRVPRARRQPVAGVARHPQPRTPHAAGRGRNHRRVEFPAQHVRRQDRPGARSRQYGGVQAGRLDADHHPGNRCDHRRDPSGGRGQRHHRCGSDGGRRPGRASVRAHDLDDRLVRDREARNARLRRHAEAPDAGTRRQECADRHARRRSRPCRARHHARRVPESGPGVHGRFAHLRAPEHQRGAQGKGRGPDPETQHGRPVR